MSRLSPIMFRFNCASPGNPFGLHHGQMSAHPLVPDAIWFNGDAEVLGWGDITVKNLIGLATHLDRNETFIVLPRVKLGDEYQYHRDLPRVAQNAIFVVTSGCVYDLEACLTDEDCQTIEATDKVSIRINGLVRDEVYDFLARPHASH